jgi:hypothetical protein
MLSHHNDWIRKIRYQFRRDLPRNVAGLMNNPIRALFYYNAATDAVSRTLFAYKATLSVGSAVAGPVTHCPWDDAPVGNRSS